MRIFMRCTVTHTFHVGFDTELIQGHHGDLHDELSLMREAWPRASVEIGTGRVSISYSGASSEQLAEGAANEFREAVKRHAWWKEVQL